MLWLMERSDQHEQPSSSRQQVYSPTLLAQALERMY